MKTIHGIKLGGLQQKIFNLMLIFIIALVGSFAAVKIYQQSQLTEVVEAASKEQQRSITEISEKTMEDVLDGSLKKTTALQAYIAGDLFSDVRSDVLTLQAFAEEIFANTDRYEYPTTEIHVCKSYYQATRILKGEEEILKNEIKPQEYDEIDDWFGVTDKYGNQTTGEIFSIEMLLNRNINQNKKKGE